MKITVLFTITSTWWSIVLLLNQPMVTANSTPKEEAPPFNGEPARLKKRKLREGSIVGNWNFEDSTVDPWTAVGSSTVSIVPSQDHAYSGLYGGLVTGRTADWTGISQSLMEKVQIKVNYQVSVWAKLVDVPDDASQPFKLQLQEISDDTTIKYNILAEGEITNQWKQFHGSYSLEEAGSLADLLLMVRGPDAGYSFAVDDVVISTPKEYIVGSNDNTEQVMVPRPPIPDLSSTRSTCPQNGSHVNWSELFPDPIEGDDLSIPEETSVIITESIPIKLGLVTIPSTSQLVFDENPNGITMDVSGMDVQGSLVAGSESCRYETPLTITLHGDRPSGITDIANERPPSYKGISVTGRIDLHGKRYFQTWTRLARRANKGEDYLYLQDQVNWEPGQKIVLVTTAMRDTRDWHQNEVLEIASLQTTNLPDSDVAAILHLKSAIEHDHIARPEYQGEVGLLTRTIKIQGSSVDSPPTDVSTDTCQYRNKDGESISLFGYDQVACPDRHLTGYGGHVMVHSSGVGYVEGVELYRMGQTNVMARYPMHFHLLGDDCPGCYLKDSSIHESYYRCLSIHATNGVKVTENVAFDVTGFCYYLEDGVEERNTIAYNLAAHIHTIGTPATGHNQYLDHISSSVKLTMPGDVAASGFYITNLQNTIIGNTAVGGWAGFAVPILQKPLGPSAALYPNFSPANRTASNFDGNVAHSTGLFWKHASAFYFGGVLYEDENGTLTYTAGRHGDVKRTPCTLNDNGECEASFNRITNSKVYLAPNVGIGSWSGEMEVVGYECHDVGLALQALNSGFWIDDMLAVCRTGESLVLPEQRADLIRGDGFFWYDTLQEHIMTNSVFRNCGYRSDEFDQYDTSETRGCDSNPYNGCSSESSTFGFVTHSDRHNPEIMQGTRNITFDNVGRRFKFTSRVRETVSGRIQNWFDADGSVSGLDGPTLIGSGVESAGKWWRVDEGVVEEYQGPLTFIEKDKGPARGLAHIRLGWDSTLHNSVGKTACSNGDLSINCNAVGSIRHLGTQFNSLNDPIGGLPVTANADIAGLAGGYGWLLSLDGGAPRSLKIEQIEVMPDTPLTLSVQYPLGTSFEIKAKAAKESCTTTCSEVFTAVDSRKAVRESDGNVYHFDDTTGLLTIRIIMFPENFVSVPEWKLYDFEDPGMGGDDFALQSYERGGVVLPKAGRLQSIQIVADCENDGVYCNERPPLTSDIDEVCDTPRFQQVSYDRCCSMDDPNDCEYSVTPASEAPTEDAPTDEPPSSEPHIDERPTGEPSETKAPTSESPIDERPTGAPPETKVPSSEPPIDELPTGEPPETEETWNILSLYVVAGVGFGVVLLALVLFSRRKTIAGLCSKKKNTEEQADRTDVENPPKLVPQ